MKTSYCTGYHIVRMSNLGGRRVADKLVLLAGTGWRGGGCFLGLLRLEHLLEMPSELCHMNQWKEDAGLHS